MSDADLLREAAAKLREDYAEPFAGEPTNEAPFHLAVADWLEEVYLARRTLTRHGRREIERALAVARAFLGATP